MYSGHARLCVCACVCVSVRGRTPTLLHGPGCDLGAWYRLPPSCALLDGFAIGAPVALLWQHNANPSLREVCARCWLVTGGWQRRSQHCAPYIASGRGWLAGDWPSTGGGRCQHYCGGLDCGLPMAAFWRHNANAKMLASTCLYSLCAWLMTVVVSSTCYAWLLQLCTDAAAARKLYDWPRQRRTQWNDNCPPQLTMPSSIVYEHCAA